jgi:hypothetical protein
MRFVAWAMSSVLVMPPAMLFAGQVGAPQIHTPDRAQAEISFQFERPGVSVPRFSIRLHEDGTGSYQAEQVERPSTDTSVRGEEAQHIDRAIQLSPATVERLFKTARGFNYFDTTCASKVKNVADTGKKTLSYTGTDGHGSCIYNYSDNKNIEAAGDTFIAIAYTLDEGRRLEFLHRYDRLGLDAEMTMLAQEAEAGRAMELGNISKTLTAIADDMAVMQRVRLRAVKLLDQTK